MSNAKHPIQQMCEEMDLQTRSYSGRGMYGKKCLGIECDNILYLVGNILTAMAEDGLTERLADVGEHIRNARQDSMGLGQIVYFPTIPYVETDDGSDESEDE